MLPYVGTISAARDMDLIRSAVGDKGLTYYGASYGTYLGAFYADLFPRHVRTMVLDGAVDPKLSGRRRQHRTGEGLRHGRPGIRRGLREDRRLPAWDRLGRAALAQLARLFQQTDKKPLKNNLGDGRVVDESLVELGVAARCTTSRRGRSCAWA